MTKKVMEKNDLKIIEIKTTLSIDSKWDEKLFNFFSTLASELGPKWENYTKRNFDLEGHLSYSILLHQGEIVTGCGIYNGGRYPAGIYRIMNRVFVSPEFRTFHKNYPYLATKYLINGQLEKGEDSIKCYFTSREGENGHYFLKHWIQNNEEILVKDWIVSDRLYHVAPNGENQSCYQYIAFPRLMSENINLIKSISLDEWKSLKD